MNGDSFAWWADYKRAALYQIALRPKPVRRSSRESLMHSSDGGLGRESGWLAVGDDFAPLEEFWAERS